NTVGKLVEGREPHEVAARTKTTWKPAKQVRPLTVLDPACGSGSFLIGAYQYLLDWYRDWYVEHDPAQFKDRVYQVREDEWRLTTAERKRILLDHIYGVDIDPQAVEVTKLSLLLKVLEGETNETIQRQLFAKHRALPDLSSNVKCGNSLIGPDFYDNQQLDMFDEEERLRVNAFDWNTEFAEIMRGGGFDAVIGNPPYIDSEWMTTYLKTTREYCVPRYRAASGNWDIFCVFCEKALSLCADGGLHSFIVPNKIGSAGYAAGARSILAHDNTLVSVRDYSHVPVFPVSVYPIVYTSRRADPNHNSATVLLERMYMAETERVDIEVKYELSYTIFSSDVSRPWEIFATVGASGLMEKLRKHRPLGEVVSVSGAATVAEAYEIKQLIDESPQTCDGQLRLVNSGTIDRYSCLWGVKKCRYLKTSFLRPSVLRQREGELPAGRLRQARTPKIIVAGMTEKLESMADLDGDMLAGKSTTIIHGNYDLKVLLGVLNSRVVSFFYLTSFGGDKLQGKYLRIGPPQLKTIPIAHEKSGQQNTESSIASCVERIQSLCVRKHKAKTAHERTALERQIAAMDRRIDELVYQLYGLSDEEIALVEEATAG
ncbi:MAG: Eco57I restriction-modification methylase domain-containing protein, partial [Planctomycetales bacterium]|nr:Eco57I restriction-modification methylase domain-containing protein [Planctomycetales bacterium]